ncbi:tetratricopeptide repeat protein [Leptobacterium flavescens]|uniref:Tetratricopeptide repeat protein n=1 Tax=Leptobacterium flavescens TaxID=472055 RepID=A0A6P0ULF0_9FLAO|nr:tetratricopeptide repeat protein [Leptobacterium flavescens]NER11883.1 tetratricopeptide repeat protein [Leptobacterium flavescens]
MRKQILIFSALAISTISFAQKKELKSAEKALKGGNTAEAQTALSAAEPLLANADVKTKAKFYLLKGKVKHDMAKKGTGDAYTEAVAAFKEVISIEDGSKKTYTEEAKTLMNTISAELVNSAVESAQQTKNYKEAARKLYMAYELDPANEDYLYFAANYAVTDNDYDTALDYYLKLKELKHTGVITEYYAVNVETGEEEKLPNKQQRDLFVKAKTHSNPTEKQTESRFPEIVKNIALIYAQQGKIEEAVAAVKDAREANPSDVNLLLTEANLYIKLDNKEKFEELMKEAVQKDPDNPVLYFNLGVISAEQNNYDQAKGYYEKSIEIDPNYKDSYLNLASLILTQEGPIVDEMNSLGTSRADNVRYDELKKKREGLYTSAVPYLEKILDIDANDVDALKTLMNIHGTLGNTAKFRELKEKLAALEQ